MTVLIEGFDPDAVGLARFLSSEGASVRLAGAGSEPPGTEELRALGILVEPYADLDEAPGDAEVAYLDPWTPETAPRVGRLRAQGARVSCLGDLLLERWPGPTIGITGTAGKTSTTSLVAAILQAAGLDVAVSCGARAGNLWPTADLLTRLAPGVGMPTLLLELTSSHLAFMRHSPRLAAVTSFWPDHLELHGGLERYRCAKETIVRHQREGDIVVVNADDGSAGFVAATPAERVEISLRGPVVRGAYVEPARGLVVVDSDGEASLGHLERVAPHPANAVAAAAIAAAAGAVPAAIERGIRQAPSPLWRSQPAGSLRGVPVTDDGMAATPSKTAATLARHADGSIVLIAGGLEDAGGGPVHSSPEERRLLEQACDEVARAARLVVIFGAAGTRLVGLLRERRVRLVEVDDLAAAVHEAARHVEGARALVFSPLFPVSLDDRARFATLLARER